MSGAHLACFFLSWAAASDGRSPRFFAVIGRLRIGWVGWLGWLLAFSAPAQELNATLGESVLQVPSGGLTEPELEVTVYRPPGDGPFPILLVNHGRAPGDAKLQSRYRPVLVAAEFVQRGWAVVVPMRQGFSKSGGREITGGCNVASNGEQQARSVRRTLDWLGVQPWADVSRNVVAGQSHGGLTTLAYGQAPHPGTRLLLNFAGGLRQDSCTAWQRGLVVAIGDYGRATRLPSIWFYGDNDSFFAPNVWQEAHQRYVDAGGRAELVAFGRFGSDSHAMFGSRAGLPIWLPKVIAALDAAGLPTRVLHPAVMTSDVPAPPASGFAQVGDLDRLPIRGDRARQGYQAWLAADGPKAFAIHAIKGQWASAWGGDRPLLRALQRCERGAQQPCRLYAVDDQVVWAPE